MGILNYPTQPKINQDIENVDPVNQVALNYLKEVVDPIKLIPTKL